MRVSTMNIYIVCVCVCVRVRVCIQCNAVAALAGRRPMHFIYRGVSTYAMRCSRACRSKLGNGADYKYNRR